MFSRAEVEAVAALANLELDENEIELFGRQLGEILAYADEVQQVDSRGIPPTASVLTRYPADRPDQVRPSLPPEKALANAPDAVLDSTPDQAKSGGLFRVPRVIG
jgi:aspartyl-tRNA(Asn)/glutamyl-tRNA(Gln) amidotransferase subunit C